MNIRSLFFILLAILFTHSIFGWGQTGHRVVGQIATEHLEKKTLAKLKRVLGSETLSEASNYMDFIRSDSEYKHLDPWHYATIPDQTKYHQAPEDGDIILAINQFIEELKSGKFTQGDEAFTLKCLVHLIGDIHQPLHVGNGSDRGGNDVKVEYFWESSNLHRVWDSGIIDEQQLSYTEYSNWINHPSEEDIMEWQSATILDWAYESAGYRLQVYDLPESKNINYDYNFKNLELVNKRLLQAGIRLAGILNQIYG